jgi:urea transporter
MLTASRLHLIEAREHYTQHLAFAFLVGMMLIGAGIACMLHSLIPGICRKTASQTVQALGELFRDRSRLPLVAAAMSGSLVLVGLLILSVPMAVALLLIAHKAIIAVPLALILLAVPGVYIATNPNLKPVF